MKKVVFTVVTVAILLLLTGCTTKQTDSQGVKIAKGVVNAPGYALIGVASATQFVAGAALAPFIWVGEQLDSNSTDSNSTIADQNATSLDINTSIDTNSTKNIEVWFADSKAFVSMFWEQIEGNKEQLKISIPWDWFLKWEFFGGFD